MAYSRLILLGLLALGGSKPPECAVRILTPLVQQPPLRYVKIQITIENRVAAQAALFDELSEITLSDINAGPRTSWIEWKDLYGNEGPYEVDLGTATGCRAKATFEVVSE